MKTRAANKASVRIIGLVVGVVGWVALASLSATKLMVGAPRDPDFLLVGLTVAFALVATGAALVIVDALNAGFGALDAFFTAALARASQRREEPRTHSQQQRGYIGDRPFVANADGSITVETLFGPRHFSSLADAQEFVGS